jgi:hypothetical protein
LPPRKPHFGRFRGFLSDHVCYKRGAARLPNEAEGSRPDMEYAQLLDDSTVWIIDNALNLAIAFLVLIGGVIISSFVARHAGDILPRTRAIDTTIAPLLGQVARYAILILTGVIVLSQQCSAPPVSPSPWHCREHCQTWPPAS